VKRKAQKSAEPSLRDKLSQKFLEALEADFAMYGAEVLTKMRETDPTRYAELAGKLIMSAEPPGPDVDFNKARSMHDMGRLLLKSVGLDDPSDEEVTCAIAANDAFVQRLEEIRDRAQN
jgi:hypothetical protein